eukprot:1147522-Rhodomonas_salina.2
MVPTLSGTRRDCCAPAHIVSTLAGRAHGRNLGPDTAWMVRSRAVLVQLPPSVLPLPPLHDAEPSARAAEFVTRAVCVAQCAVVALQLHVLSTPLTLGCSPAHRCGAL